MTDTSAPSARKIDGRAPTRRCPVEQGPDGVWRVTGFDAARAVLRSQATVQAGAGADTVGRLPPRMRRPVLFQDGPEHREQRRRIAHFFTQKRVDTEYRAMMHGFADSKIEQLKARGHADLDQLSFALAVDIVAAVIGLTNSRPGMSRRLDRFFLDRPGGHGLHGLLYGIYRKGALLSLHLNDVRPAIRARRRQRADDVISHLIDSGCNDAEILTECVTFAPAGMITTREFINVAAWHLLTDDGLRERYRAADEPERIAILQEILRLEPVINSLARRTTAPIDLPDGSGVRTIPAGCLVDISLSAANVDPAAVGPQPWMVRAGRPLGDGVKESGLSFGDGAHKCPGSHIALLEADIFLDKLFALPGLRLVATPSIGHKEEFATFELRDLTVAVEPRPTG